MNKMKGCFQNSSKQTESSGRITSNAVFIMHIANTIKANID